MLFYFIESLIFFTAIICFVYVCMITSFIYGWIRTSENILANTNPISVAIIVAARNEENNILNCLNSMIKQSYSKSFIEIIVVDDSSEDSTSKLVRSFMLNHSNVKLIQLSEKKVIGKKNAIACAISQTNAELIVTTDADCTMGIHWIESIVAAHQTTPAKMIVGPVAFSEENTTFKKMQSLEFMALIASSAGSLYYNKAIMCNGANLAYSKKIFEELNGFEEINSTPTGDDVLWMYKIKKEYPKGIVFLKNKNAIVYTKAQDQFSGFLAQRKRWASKSFSSMNGETKFVAFIVYLMNFCLLSATLLTAFASLKALIYLPFFKICLILLAFKCFIDFLLLFLSASFFDKKHLLRYFLPEQLLYMVYIVFVGMLGNKGKYVWKGRKIN